MKDPRTKYPQPPFDTPLQKEPGDEYEMNPLPDYGEDSYKGNNKLKVDTKAIEQKIPFLTAYNIFVFFHTTIK